MGTEERTEGSEGSKEIRCSNGSIIHFGPYNPSEEPCESQRDSMNLSKRPEVGGETFPLSHVLSVATDYLFCDVGGLYKILNHITGDNLYTHMLPRALSFAAPRLKERFPELAAIDIEEHRQRLAPLLAGEPDREARLSAIAAWLLTLPLPRCFDIPCLSEEWEAKDCIQELADEIGEDRVKARAVIVKGGVNLSGRPDGGGVV